MPPKKPAKKTDPTADDSTERLYRQYRRNLTEAGLPLPPKLMAKFNELRAEKTPQDLKELFVWDELGAAGMKALADALKTVEYKHLQQVRMWEAWIEDEGLRALCSFLEGNTTVRALEIVNCRITPLGSEFLAKLFGPEIRSSISELKLDHNVLGDQGAIILGSGLSMTTSLKSLSLAYCGINAVGAKGVFDILINSASKLTSLNLQGNYLRNEGVIKVMQALTINASLTTIDLSDNQFDEHESVLNAFADCFWSNKILKDINLAFNRINEPGATVLKDAMVAANEEGVRRNTSLKKVTLPMSISKALVKEINTVCKKNKKGKKKKRGKKGKKGKKSKK